MSTDYAKAKETLEKYVKTESLRNHAKAVSGVMAHFAKKYGEDVEYWSCVGLLHDVDYEMYPDEHCKKVVDILTEEGYDKKFINSIVSHGYNICSDVMPTHIMEKVLYASDELTGLINATTLMRPDKNIQELKYSSVKKKFKQASFASGVDRTVILNGVEMLGCDFQEFVEDTICGMQEVAGDIGLSGE